VYFFLSSYFRSPQKWQVLQAAKNYGEVALLAAKTLS